MEICVGFNWINNLVVVNWNEDNLINMIYFKYNWVVKNWLIFVRLNLK